MTSQTSLPYAAVIAVPACQPTVKSNHVSYRSLRPSVRLSVCLARIASDALYNDHVVRFDDTGTPTTAIKLHASGCNTRTHTHIHTELAPGAKSDVYDYL